MTDQQFVHAVLSHCKGQPNAPALVWRGHTLTYGDLGRAVARARTTLDALGAGGYVGVHAAHSPATLALMIACMSAGRPFVIPAVDLPEGDLHQLLAQTGCDRHLRAEAGPGATDVEVVSAPVDGRGPTTPPSAVTPLFLLTTSGSTGLPKVVPVLPGAVSRFAHWAAERFGIGPGVRVLSYAPLNFDLSVLDVWTTLASGGCVVLVDRDRAASPRYLLELVTAARPDIVQAVPMLHQMLVDTARVSGVRLGSVTRLLYSGYAMPDRVLRQLPEVFPRARVFSVYGCTEINDAFVQEIDPSTYQEGPVPLGDALPGVRWLICDARGRALRGPGVGELWVATPFQTPGYVDQRLDEGRFAVHPDGPPGLRYFRPRDLVRRHEDGTLTLEGRTDFHVKVRGVQVSTEGVEKTILQLEGVIEAAVVAVPDDRTGNRLQAVVRVGSDSGLDTLAVRQYCTTRLPPAARPTSVRLTPVPLPRTESGKIDRRVLARAARGDG
ncbi:AMP-binding protein [Streptomyces sp. NPDC048057]|uniref:AMP-binding protein n=1 Tax=Streptomyces sp. NPDC048057 TaxID=3155628 RepID=UPI0033FBDE75